MLKRLALAAGIAIAMPAAATATPLSLSFELLATTAFDPAASCMLQGECLNYLAQRWLATTGIRNNQVETYSDTVDVAAAPDLPTSVPPPPLPFPVTARLDSLLTLDYAQDTWRWQTSLPIAGSSSGGSSGGSSSGGNYFVFDIFVANAGLVDGDGFQMPSITGATLLAESSFSMTLVVNGVATTVDGAARGLTQTVVPEPATLALLALGLIGLAVGGGRRRAA